MRGLLNLENKLAGIATFSQSERMANLAMWLLRKLFNKQYHWCPDFDYLAKDNKNCDCYGNDLFNTSVDLPDRCSINIQPVKVSTQQES